MKNIQEIRDLAALRIAEAEYLMQNKSNDFSAAAFYLAGYAVELTLKARICELLDADEFYKEGSEYAGHSAAFKIHKIDKLIVLAGLQKKITAEKKQNKKFKNTVSSVVYWKETSRYELSTSKLESEEFIKNVKIFIQWIEQQKIT